MQYTVVAPVVAVHKEPSRTSPLVSQLVHGDQITVAAPAAERDYTFLGDGWVHSAQLVDGAASALTQAYVIDTVTVHGTLSRRVPFGARVPYAVVDHSDVRHCITEAAWAAMSVESRVRIACASLLGAAYLPGGTSSWGVDCSGLLWRAFRFAGIDIPRLVRNMGSMGREVPVDARKQFGDVYLIAGRNGSIRHCALHMGPNAVLHARMTTSGAVRTGMDDLGGPIVTVRRLLTEAP